MAKEFKQRTIKKNNNKYIKMSIVVVSVIAMLILIIVLISKKNKDNIVQNPEEKVEQNININNGIQSENPINDIVGEEKVESNNMLGVPQSSNKQEQEMIIKPYEEIDATISGVTRNMNEEQVRDLLGVPESMYKEENIMGDEKLVYVYNSGDTKINFIIAPNGRTYIVHTIYTTSKNSVLPRKLKIGDTAETIVQSFNSDNILYLTDELIVIGYYGENPMYATSLKSKIYFTIKNNMITEVLISIGNES